MNQEGRPGLRSRSSPNGWHTDHQSGPHFAVWPGVALTLHVAPTAPADGLLRVLPGSHLGGTEGIPAGFDLVPGAMMGYHERGDIPYSHADLCHGATRPHQNVMPSFGATSVTDGIARLGGKSGTTPRTSSRTPWVDRSRWNRPTVQSSHEPHGRKSGWTAERRPDGWGPRGRDGNAQLNDRKWNHEPLNDWYTTQMPESSR